MFYGLTAIDLRQIAFEFAEKNNIQHTFNGDKKMAGKDWLQSFLRRHPNLSLRKPEATSLGRISGFNAESVGLFFNNLDEVLKKYNFQASRIFNVDETGVTTVQVPSKIIAPKGVKQLGKAVSWERGRNITACCSISASGVYIPPMFIYPRTRMSEQLKRNGPVDAIYECSTKGWMNEELFLTWLKHFKKHAAASKENPLLLLLDNHSSHCSLSAYEFCRQNGIIMLSFPPHTSHKLQPLDLTFFGPLKSAYSKECSLFMRQNVHQKITPFDVAEIFNRAFVHIATIEKAQKGFEISGIVPYKPNIFTDEDFLPATLSNIPAVELKEYEDDVTPSTSKTNQAPSKTSVPQINEPDIVPSTSKTNNESQANISIEEITPLSIVRKNGTTKRGRKLGISKILTATPEKIELEQKEKRKIQKKKKQKVPLRVKKVTKKVKFDDSSSSSSSQDEKKICNDHSSEDPDSDMEEECILCGEYGKSEMWYRCGLCHRWAHKECTGFDN